MKYLDKKDMNPKGLAKFFEEAIVNKEAVEIHLSSEKFPHEIDLIPYDQVALKAEWYNGSVYYKVLSETEGAMVIFDKKNDITRTITDVKINWENSAAKDVPRYGTLLELRKDYTEKDDYDTVSILIKKKSNYKNTKCPKCGGEMIPEMGTAMMSNPPKYRTKCSCGEIGFVPTHVVDDSEEWVTLRKVKEMLV